MAPAKPRRKDGISLKSLAPILCFCIYSLSWSCADAQVVIPNQGSSSPSEITALKNSNVRLHWNYSFEASPHVIFVRQEWTVKDMQNTSYGTYALAEKTVPNGTITVSTSLPTFLSGRVAAFAINDTIMISNLQFNDSLYKFDSFAHQSILRVGPQTIPTHLKPTVSLSVIGAPEYTSTPAKSMEVSEGGELPVALHFDGNPKPTAELQWSHSSAKVAMTVTKEYEFIYKATYSLKPVTSNYCGRTFNVRAENSIGKATDVSTTVTVLLNFGNPYVRAGKRNRTCVEVDWFKKDSGACNVTYTVNFKTAAGETKLVYTGVNVGKVTKCGIAANVNITNVELIMSSTNRNKTFSASVSESPLPQRTTVPPPTSAPTTKAPANKPPKSGANTGAIVGGVIGGLVAVVLILLLVMFFIKRRKQGKGKYTNSGETGLPLADKK